MASEDLQRLTAAAAAAANAAAQAAREETNDNWKVSLPEVIAAAASLEREGQNLGPMRKIRKLALQDQERATKASFDTFLAYCQKQARLGQLPGSLEESLPTSMPKPDVEKLQRKRLRQETATAKLREDERTAEVEKGEARDLQKQLSVERQNHADTKARCRSQQATYKSVLKACLTIMLRDDCQMQNLQQKLVSIGGGTFDDQLTQYGNVPKEVCSEVLAVWQKLAAQADELGPSDSE